jgi:hypothetical protein
MTTLIPTDIYATCLWLCVESEKVGGHAASAEVLIQMLQSTLMSKLLADTEVSTALSKMVEYNDVHIGLDAVNCFMVTCTDEIAVRYLEVLRVEHGHLIDPPFTATDSRIWYFRQWPVSHFNHLLVEL